MRSLAPIDSKHKIPYPNVKKAEKPYRFFKLSLAASLTASILDCVALGVLFGKDYFLEEDNEIMKLIPNIDKYLFDTVLGLSICVISFGSFTLRILLKNYHQIKVVKLFNKVRTLSNQLKKTNPNYDKIQKKLSKINAQIQTNHSNLNVTDLYRELASFHTATQNLIPLFPII